MRLTLILILTGKIFCLSVCFQINLTCVTVLNGTFVSRLFQSGDSDSNSVFEKLKCILNYFRRICSSGKNIRMTSISINSHLQ